MGGKWQKTKPKTQPKKCDLLYVSRNQERVQRKWLKIDFLAKFLFCKGNRWRNFSDFRKMEEKKKCKKCHFLTQNFQFFFKKWKSEISKWFDLLMFQNLKNLNRWPQRNPGEKKGILVKHFFIFTYFPYKKIIFLRNFFSPFSPVFFTNRNFQKSEKK